MTISIHYVYRDRHDSNLKNSIFAEVTKHNEEYLGVLEINVLFSRKIFSSAETKIFATPIQMLMPMPMPMLSCRCQDSQMAVVKCYFVPLPRLDYRY